MQTALPLAQVPSANAFAPVIAPESALPPVLASAARGPILRRKHSNLTTELVGLPYRLGSDIDDEALDLDIDVVRDDDAPILEWCFWLATGHTAVRTCPRFAATGAGAG